MQIHHIDDESGDRPPEATFTGDVRIGGYFRRQAPSRLTGATVSFAPGARTPWRRNPSGQTLVVVSGEGRAQVEGGPVVPLRAGDTAWFPPGVAHWDGAAPDRSMTVVAIQEAPDGVGVHFGARVTDDEYAG